jgi:hypothetical protein
VAAKVHSASEDSLAKHGHAKLRYAHPHPFGLGMVMLSPPVISLPCKLLLFVMVDGWALVCNGVVQSFR